MNDENQKDIGGNAEFVKSEPIDGEEKKQNGFSKFWNKAKKTVSDALLESNLEGAYNRAHSPFDIYFPGNSLIGNVRVYGEVTNGELQFWSEKEIPLYSVVIEQNSRQAFYVVGITPCKVYVDYDGFRHERAGTKLTLDANVEEVTVIKAGDRYFKYKG